MVSSEKGLEDRTRELHVPVHTGQTPPARSVQPHSGVHQATVHIPAAPTPSDYVPMSSIYAPTPTVMMAVPSLDDTAAPASAGVTPELKATVIRPTYKDPSVSKYAGVRPALRPEDLE